MRAQKGMKFTVSILVLGFENLWREKSFFMCLARELSDGIGQQWRPLTHLRSSFDNLETIANWKLFVCSSDS